jgi:transcriptional regulator with XRE-family HTH domain
MSKFSEKLKHLRESNEWSKTNVAKHLGVGLSTYANWEYGYSEPDIDMINRIAKLYGVSNDFLMGNDTKDETKHVDLARDPVVLSFNGELLSQDDLDIIKAVLRRHDEK